MTIYAVYSAGPFDWRSPEIYIDDSDGLKLTKKFIEDWGLDETFTYEELMDTNWQHEQEIKIEEVTITTL